MTLRKLSVLAALAAVVVTVGAGAASRAVAAPTGATTVTAQNAVLPGGSAANTGALLVHWQPSGGSRVRGYAVQVLDASGREVASQTCTAACTSALLGNLPFARSYQVQVATVPAGSARTVSLSPVAVQALVPPDAPTSAAASEVPGSDQLAVTWAPATTGDAAAWFHVLTWDVTNPATPQYLSDRKCGMNCTSTVIDLLSSGHRYAVAVVAANAAGASRFIAASAGVEVDTGCAVDACLTADATAPAGAEMHPGQGFVHGLTPATDPAQVAALRPSWWRLNTGSAAAPTYSTFDTAHAAGARIMNLLSDDWLAATGPANGGFAEAPWTDGWNDYRTFVVTKVRADLAAGRRPEVWEVQNEPGAPYLNAADTSAFSVDRQLQQFLVAYEAIRSVDPAALVAGPASVAFATQADTYATTPPRVDLATFLQFCQDHHLLLGALTWHEDLDVGGATDLDGQPVNATQHVAEARALLARYDVGSPLVIVSEYLGPVLHALPGWVVGELGALDGAGVDGAMRTCWWNPQEPLQSSDCQGGALDGLLMPSGGSMAPTGTYQAYLAYAQMTGQRIPLRSSNTSITGVATTDGQDLRVLVGQHWSCDVMHNLLCPLGSPQRGAATTALRLRLPSPGTYRLAATDLPYDSLSNPSPSVYTAAPSTVTTDAGGWATFTLGGLADGDARSIVLTPAG